MNLWKDGVYLIRPWLYFSNFMTAANVKKYQWYIFIISLIATIYIQVKIFNFIEPSSFDFLIELKMQGFAPQVKKSILIDNIRPQLGMLTFYIASIAGYLGGYAGALLLRYLLFVGNILVLYQIFNQVSKTNFSTILKTSIFLLSLSLSFFFVFKYFHVEEHLSSLFFFFLAVVIYLKNKNPFLFFLCLMLSAYLKLSVIVFTMPALVLFCDQNKNYKRYYTPLVLSFIFFSIMLIYKNVHSMIYERGLFQVLTHFDSVPFIIKNILAPWSFFQYFDDSQANYFIESNWYHYAKAGGVVFICFNLFTKNKRKFLFDLCVWVIVLVASVGVQTIYPTLHDFGFSLGLVGLMSVFVFWKNISQVKMPVILCVAIIYTLDYMSWLDSIDSMELKLSKKSFIGEVKAFTYKNKINNVFFYCQNNVGEFEWEFLRDGLVKVDYIIDETDFKNKMQEREFKKGLHVLPGKCLHVESKFKSSDIFASNFKAMKEFKLSKYESYSLSLFNDGLKNEKTKYE